MGFIPIRNVFFPSNTRGIVNEALPKAFVTHEAGTDILAKMYPTILPWWSSATYDN